jgi:predicted N-acetyltransferase YhbS
MDSRKSTLENRGEKMVQYRQGKSSDKDDILELATRELDVAPRAMRLLEDLDHYPSEVAFDDRGIRGFVLSEDLAPNILLVSAIAVRSEQRCDGTGRGLLELLESDATRRGYHGIVVSEFAQGALLGCDSDTLTFAGYRKIYDTGGTSLLVKSLN